MKTAKAYLSDPTNPILKAEYDRAVEQMKASTAQIQLASLGAAIDQEMRRVMEALNVYCISDVSDISQIGDEQGAKAASEKLTENLKSFAELSKQTAAHIKNEAQRKKLLEKVAILENLIPKITPAVVAVARDPQNAAARKELEKIFAELQQAAHAVTDLVLRPIDHHDVVTVKGK